MSKQVNDIVQRASEVVLRCEQLQTRKSSPCSVAVLERFISLCDSKNGPNWQQCTQRVVPSLLTPCKNKNTHWLMARRAPFFLEAIVLKKIETGDAETSALQCEMNIKTNDKAVKIHARLYPTNDDF